MDLSNAINKLPHDIQYLIYGFIDINTRLQLLKNNNNIIGYFQLIALPKRIQCFENLIQKKLLKSKNRCYVLQTYLSKHLPQAIIMGRHGSTRTLNHGISMEICRISHLHYMPRPSQWNQRNLTYKQNLYLNDQIRSIYSLFYSLSGDISKRFIYIIKKILFKFMLFVIIEKKEAYQIIQLRRQHNIIKEYTKKNLLRFIRQKGRAYERRAKKRIKEAILLAKKQEKADKRENRMLEKEKKDGLSRQKKAFKNACKNKETIIIIRRRM